MELIHIGEGKLKVMLTEEDMALYALDTALSDGGGAEARRVVRDILDAAGAPLGFAAAQDKICIQIFRGRGGGCELFVSCAETGGTRRLLYAFATVSDLARVCRLLAAQGFAGASAAYLGDDGRLFLSLKAARGGEPPHALDFLAEYGTPCAAGGAALAEHAVRLTEDAVKTLAPLAVV